MPPLAMFALTPHTRYFDPFVAGERPSTTTGSLTPWFRLFRHAETRTSSGVGYTNGCGAPHFPIVAVASCNFMPSSRSTYCVCTLGAGTSRRMSFVDVGWLNGRRACTVVAVVEK